MKVLLKKYQKNNQELETVKEELQKKAQELQTEKHKYADLNKKFEKCCENYEFLANALEKTESEMRLANAKCLKIKEESEVLKDFILGKSENASQLQSLQVWLHSIPFLRSSVSRGKRQGLAEYI